MAKPHGFTSAAHRRAVFAENPTLGHNIANKYGAKIGGGFTQAQIKRNPTLQYHGKKATDPGQ